MPIVFIHEAPDALMSLANQASWRYQNAQQQQDTENLQRSLQLGLQGQAQQNQQVMTLAQMKHADQQLQQRQQFEEDQQQRLFNQQASRDDAREKARQDREDARLNASADRQQQALDQQYLRDLENREFQLRRQDQQDNTRFLLQRDAIRARQDAAAGKGPAGTAGRGPGGKVADPEATARYHANQNREQAVKFAEFADKLGYKGDDKDSQVAKDAMDYARRLAAQADALEAPYNQSAAATPVTTGTVQSNGDWDKLLGEQLPWNALPRTIDEGKGEERPQSIVPPTTAQPPHGYNPAPGPNVPLTYAPPVAGSFVDAAQLPQNAIPSNSLPVLVRNAAEYAKLPPGTKYIDPEGNVATKRR